MALPRFGHLMQLRNIFSYLKKHHNVEMFFDPCEPNIDQSEFPRIKWSDSVCDSDDCNLIEPVPLDMPEPQDEGMTMPLFVDSDHADDIKTEGQKLAFWYTYNLHLFTGAQRNKYWLKHTLLEVNLWQ